MSVNAQKQGPATLNPASVVASLFAVYVIWGSTYLAIRFAIEGFPPLLMGGIRFVIAGGAMYTFLRIRGVPAPTKSAWFGSTVIGGLMMVGGVGVVSVAEDLGVGSGVAATGIAAVPLWAAFWARLIGERTTRTEAVGLVVGFVGVAILASAGDLAVSPFGAILILISPMLWALGSVWSKRIELPAGTMGTATQMLTGGVLLLLIGGAVGERIVVMPAVAAWLALGYLIVFGSVVALTSYMYLLRTVRPTLATSYAYVNPVVAVVLGVSLGGETVSGQSLTALPIILLGVGLLAAGRSGWGPARRRNNSRSLAAAPEASAAHAELPS